MQKNGVIVAATLLWLGCAAQLTHAGSNPKATIGLFLFPTNLGTSTCTTFASLDACGLALQRGDIVPATYYAYVVVGKATAVGGVHFGIHYDDILQSGVDVFSWTSCADSQTPSAGWPGAGTGITLAWDSPSNCQSVVPPGAGGAVAVAGYFYCAAYAADALTITAHPGTRTAEVVDCSGTADVVYDADACVSPFRLGRADFGGGSGYDPCAPWIPWESECGAIGPAEVASGARGVVYENPFSGSGCQYVWWTVSGEATIVSPAVGDRVTLNIGAPGTFTLQSGCRYDIDAGASCCKRVTVADPVLVEPRSWSQLKTHYR